MTGSEAETGGTGEGIVLEAEGLSLVYRTRNASIAALEGLDLRVGVGEFLSLIGPSGCGKSSLLKLVAGLLPRTAGRLALMGSAVSGPRKEIGVVFQQPTLFPWKTVRNNVLLPAETLRLDRGEAGRRADRLLELVGLSDFAENYPSELSGGMQQRVGIARALIHDPTVLLMDEPFAALDALTREHMMMELQNIWMATGKSVLFITHSIPEAVFLSDRVAVMSARPGRILLEHTVRFGRPRDLQTMGHPDFVTACNMLRTRLSEES